MTAFDDAWDTLKKEEIESRPHLMSNEQLRLMIQNGILLGNEMRAAAERPVPPTDQFQPVDVSAPLFISRPHSAQAQRMREDFANIQDTMIDELETRHEENPWPEAMVPDDLQMPFDESLEDREIPYAYVDPAAHQMIREQLPPELAEEAIADRYRDMESMPIMGFNPGWQDINTGEPMDLSWRLLKYGAGMDGLDWDGNYPEKGPDIPQFAFRNDVTNNQSIPTRRPPALDTETRAGNQSVQFALKPTSVPSEPVTNLSNVSALRNAAHNWATGRPQPKKKKPLSLEERGFTREFIHNQRRRNAAENNAMSASWENRLHQPKGG